MEALPVEEKYRLNIEKDIDRGQGQGKQEVNYKKEDEKEREEILKGGED